MERKKIYKIIGNFLFSNVNREFLTFLVFLVISGVFWLMIMLNDTYEKEFKIPISLSDVPNTVVIGDDVDTIRVTLRDKGFVLAVIMLDGSLDENTMYFDFNRYARDGKGIIPAQDVIKQLKNDFISVQGKVLQIKPDRIEFFYNKGVSRKLPVHLVGNIDPQTGYYISRTIISPDSVLVYASDAAFDTLMYVETQRINLSDFTEPQELTPALRKIRGAKLQTDYVKVKLVTDMLTDGTIDVPVTGINMPQGIVLRTFPAKVKVLFKSGMRRFKSLKASDFSIVVDYNDIINNPSDKCRILLQKTPHDILDPRIEINSIDYLLEKE